MSSVNKRIWFCGSGSSIRSCGYSIQPQNIGIHGTIENGH